MLSWRAGASGRREWPWLLVLGQLALPFSCLLNVATRIIIRAGNILPRNEFRSIRCFENIGKQWRKQMSPTRVELRDEVAFRELNGEGVLLDLVSGTYFGLNEVGARLWTLLSQNN